jgi:hypothetical protein
MSTQTIDSMAIQTVQKIEMVSRIIKTKIEMIVFCWRMTMSFWSRSSGRDFKLIQTTTPCTVVIFTEDKVHFPIKTALTVIRHLFQ